MNKGRNVKQYVAHFGVWSRSQWVLRIGAIKCTNSAVQTGTCDCFVQKAALTDYMCKKVKVVKANRSLD